MQYALYCSSSSARRESTHHVEESQHNPLQDKGAREEPKRQRQGGQSQRHKNEERSCAKDQRRSKSGCSQHNSKQWPCSAVLKLSNVTG